MAPIAQPSSLDSMERFQGDGVQPVREGEVDWGDGEPGLALLPGPGEPGFAAPAGKP